jgi:hypothetical protein
MPPFPEDRFVEAVEKVVAANAAYVPPYGSGSLFFTNLRKNLSHQKNPHEQCSFATKAGTMFHSFYTFFKKVLEHFWKVWYIIAILIRIEPETPVRKYFFYF